jgi:hypothetical protein
LVINENLEDAIIDLVNIIRAEENKVKRFSSVLEDFYR